MELSQYRESERETIRIHKRLKREYEKAKRKEALRDLARTRQTQDEAEQEASAARAASSPLTSLRWRSSAKSEELSYSELNHL